MCNMIKIKKNTKMAWVYEEADFVLANDIGYWLASDSYEGLLDSIKENYLVGLLSELLDPFVDVNFDSFDEAYEFARHMMLGLEYSEKIVAINDVVYECRNAKTSTDMNIAFLSFSKLYEELTDKTIRVFIYDSPYDAVGLLDSHDNYSNSLDIKELEVDFNNDVMC